MRKKWSVLKRNTQEDIHRLVYPELNIGYINQSIRICKVHSVTSRGIWALCLCQRARS